jgi:hypothetical protein
VSGRRNGMDTPRRPRLSKQSEILKQSELLTSSATSELGSCQQRTGRIADQVQLANLWRLERFGFVFGFGRTS